MTYLIPPDSPKAVTATAFGEAFRRAIERQGTAIKEIERVTKIGHTTLWHYLVGAVLPKVDVAATLAEVLHDSRLLEIVREGRTIRCQNARCGRQVINNGGSIKRFCGQSCREENDRVRRLGRTKGRLTRATAVPDGRTALGAINQAQGVIRQLSGDLRTARVAVDAFCRQCEPAGTCATPDCPLRVVSPLALRLQRHPTDGKPPRTMREIRAALWTPERREKHVDAMHARWTPEAREAAKSDPAVLENLTAARVKGIVAVRNRSKASFSAASKKAWANRRARAVTEAAT